MQADLIVVGAGSAGAVVAARASERGDRDVLLIEAGPDYPDAASLPRDLRDGTRNSMRDHDWGFVHRPVPGQVLFDFPRGKVVGGSSAVNTCIALRGQPYDYDEWASLGLPEWSYEKCLPAFKRLEHDLDFDSEIHGQRGPVPIRRHPAAEHVPWQAAFLDACKALGFRACSDHNAPGSSGYGPHAMNKIDGVRRSAAACYLTPEVRARDNLRIQARTLVRRVLFDGRRATGLEVEHEGVVGVIHARQIVLSGGAVCTPGILMRSGIGPRAQLERLGVDVVADVPAVGARLLDHPGAAIILIPRSGVSNVSDPLIQNVLRYTSEGSGFPADMQLQPGSHLPLPWIEFPVVTLMCCVGKPRGAGTITWHSADPRVPPRIHSHFLEDGADRARAVEAMELAWLCSRTPAMRALISTYFWPGERVLSDRDALDSWIDKSTGSGYHPCGTVPMGTATDQYGHVNGVENLLVADASLMPTIPSSNTNLATLMIGERFGEWLQSGTI